MTLKKKYYYSISSLPSYLRLQKLMQTKIGKTVYLWCQKVKQQPYFCKPLLDFEKRPILLFDIDTHHEYMQALFIDIDNNNDFDLYLVSGESEILERSESLNARIYKNDGKGNLR
jgi:hypothetical protein